MLVSNSNNMRVLSIHQVLPITYNFPWSWPHNGCCVIGVMAIPYPTWCHNDQVYIWQQLELVYPSPSPKCHGFVFIWVHDHPLEGRGRTCLFHLSANLIHIRQARRSSFTKITKLPKVWTWIVQSIGFLCITCRWRYFCKGYLPPKKELKNPIIT